MQPYLYSFSKYTVKRLVKTDIFQISIHAPAEIIPLSAILKKKQERKHKGKINEIQEVCFLTRSL